MSKGGNKHHKLDCKCPFCKMKRGEISGYWEGKNNIKQSERQKGINNPGYKHGNCISLPKCIDCGKPLNNYKAIRCHKHASENAWKNKEYRKLITSKSIQQWKNNDIRNKNSKAIRLALQITPNKPETQLGKILEELFPNQYKFVGDGKEIIAGFNPDYVDKKRNLIIEVFGTYWHKRKEVIERDQRRLNEYSNYGYQTLIVWEHELKDLDQVKNKLITFNNAI